MFSLDRPSVLQCTCHWTDLLRGGGRVGGIGAWLQDRGNTDLVKRYLELLEGAFLFKFLPKWSGSKVRQIASSPKIVPLARARIETFYWNEGSFEVDYVVRIDGKVIAIEVKSGRRRGSSGLERFRKECPKTRAIFISPDQFESFSKDPRNYLLKNSL